VAAAREATYHGVRAMALSHYLMRGLAMDWDRITAWTTELLRDTLLVPPSVGSFFNVNFPHLSAEVEALPPIIETRPARSPLNVRFEQDGELLTECSHYAERPRDAGSDVEACFGGNVSWSCISL
jgi:5'-nucleotidase